MVYCLWHVNSSNPFSGSKLESTTDDVWNSLKVCGSNFIINYTDDIYCQNFLALGSSFVTCIHSTFHKNLQCPSILYCFFYKWLCYVFFLCLLQHSSLLQ